MEVNVIYNEDCLEGMRKLPDGCVDLVVTDPPYDMKIGGGGGFMQKADKNNWVREIKGCGFVDGFNEQILHEIGRGCRKMNAYFFCSRLQIPMYVDFIRRGGIYGICLFGTKPTHCRSIITTIL